MTRLELMQVWEDAIKNNTAYICLMIRKSGAAPEITVVPAQNFTRKRRYILKAFDENLINNRDAGLVIEEAWPMSHAGVEYILPEGD
jgi:hypothetical protein|nr:MAG TPA: hypothetical protein [Caudoviricetes sp.]